MYFPFASSRTNAIKINVEVFLPKEPELDPVCIESNQDDFSLREMETTFSSPSDYTIS